MDKIIQPDEIILPGEIILLNEINLFGDFLICNPYQVFCIGNPW